MKERVFSSYCCTMEREAYKKDGLEYCCESCATVNEACDCGCCLPAEEQREEY